MTQETDALRLATRAIDRASRDFGWGKPGTDDFVRVATEALGIEIREDQREQVADALDQLDSEFSFNARDLAVATIVLYRAMFAWRWDGQNWTKPEPGTVFDVWQEEKEVK